MRLLLLLLCLALPVFADKYVLDGGSSSACTSWSDACDQATTAAALLSRGETLWLGPGTYTGLTFDTTNSSATLITVKRATIASHGTSTGWSDSYGTGEAIFGDINFDSDDWVLDGAFRNESQWNQQNSYGIRVLGSVHTYVEADMRCGDNITVRYVDMGGAYGSSYTGSEPDDAFKVNCFIAGLSNNIIVEKSWLHNIGHAALFHMNGVNTCSLTDNYLGPAWGKEGIRGQIAFKNCVVARSIFYNSCGTATPDACTADIAIWDGSANQFDNNEIVGNLIWCDGCDGNTSSVVILVGGNGTSWAGSPASGTLIFNNTIVGSTSTSFGNTPNILVNGGSGNICRNNMWYSVVGSPSTTCSTASNNGEESSDPFADYAADDFHLAGHIAGSSTDSPTSNDVDIDGVVRGYNGTFDIGTYQYVGGDSIPTVTTTTATSITTTTASSGGNVTADGGQSVTSRGVCYATTTSPTTPCTSDGTGTGSYSSSLSGLTPNTLYYYRAFATNSVGTGYGSQDTFMTDAVASVTMRVGLGGVGAGTIPGGTN